jgi:predicted MPP superfamily phosphohydrolase
MRTRPLPGIHFHHRKSWFAVLVTLAICAAWTARAGSRQPDPPPFAITHGPSLQLPASTSVAVVWHTSRPAVSRVEYGLTDRLGSTAISAEHGLIANNRTSHIIRLTGLSPGTTYRYRVVSREFIGYEKQHIVKYGDTVSSDVFSFTTFDDRKQACSFALVSDIHENAKRLDALLAPLDWRALAFVVFDGDMVNDFMNPDQPFAGFVDTAVARFARTTPFVYVRGNHDVRGRYARLLTDYFPADNGRAYYSFNHGPVHVVVLDSGEDKVDTHEYYNGLVAFEAYRQEQARWLAEDLRSEPARRARFRVVLSHIPPYGGDTFAIQDVRKAWEGAANHGRVDLWLSGHVHRYLRFDPTPGKNRYQLVVGPPDARMQLDATPKALAVTITRETGEKLDSLVLRPR